MIGIAFGVAGVHFGWGIILCYETEILVLEKIGLIWRQIGLCFVCVLLGIAFYLNKGSKMNKILLLVPLLLFTTMSMAKNENIGKVYNPCDGWRYFTENDVNWSYNLGITINEHYYFRWQYYFFNDTALPARKFAEEQIEDITNALIETGRRELDCRKQEFSLFGGVE